MPLTQRLVENAFPHHDPRETGVPMGDMDDIGNLFRPLHAGLKALPSVQMMENPPKSAAQPTWFHHVFAKKFLQRCNPPWDERSRPEKYEERKARWPSGGGKAHTNFKRSTVAYEGRRPKA